MSRLPKPLHSSASLGMTKCSAAREPPYPDVDPQPAIERLRQVGLLEVDPIPLRSRFTIDKWNIPVIAVRARLSGHSQEPTSIR